MMFLLTCFYMFLHFYLELPIHAKDNCPTQIPIEISIPRAPMCNSRHISLTKTEPISRNHCMLIRIMRSCFARFSSLCTLILELPCSCISELSLIDPNSNSMPCAEMSDRLPFFHTQGVPISRNHGMLVIGFSTLRSCFSLGIVLPYGNCPGPLSSCLFCNPKLGKSLDREVMQ